MKKNSRCMLVFSSLNNNYRDILIVPFPHISIRFSLTESKYTVYITYHSQEWLGVICICDIPNYTREIKTGISGLTFPPDITDSSSMSSGKNKNKCLESGLLLNCGAAYAHIQKMLISLI